MFVLRECSVCLEDFDAERVPYNIPCGHVFCRPCLYAIRATPSCPNCRTTYSFNSIRKIVCENESSNESKLATSERECLMWQAIQSSVETPGDYEQRKTLVQHNSPQSLRQQKMSEGIVISLDVLHKLVKTEQQIHSLKDKASDAAAIEASLWDRISILERQLNSNVNERSIHTLRIQSLLAHVQELDSSIQLIKSEASAAVQDLNCEPQIIHSIHSPSNHAERGPKSGVSPPHEPSASTIEAGLATDRSVLMWSEQSFSQENTQPDIKKLRMGNLRQAIVPTSDHDWFTKAAPLSPSTASEDWPTLEMSMRQLAAPGEGAVEHAVPDDDGFIPVRRGHKPTRARGNRARFVERSY